MKKTLLFVSHEATLTGAPILLLNIISWLKGNSDYDLVVVLGKDGPLREKFEKVAQVINYYETPGLSLNTTLLRRLSLLDKYQKLRYQAAIKGKNIKLIFSNTIVNGTLVDKINTTKLPVITYVHELAYTIQLQQKMHGDIPAVLAHTSFFLSGSETVRQNLNSMGVPLSKIEVAYSSIPVAEIMDKLTAAEQLANSLTPALPKNKYLVVAVGNASWRKGSDWFLQLATKLTKTSGDVQMVWVGATPNTIEYMQMQYELQRYGLEDKVQLVTTTPDYITYIHQADVFVLTSREDPFPLVVLEAALAGKPTICFANSGGAPEFVGKGNGIVVPYGNVGAMAEAVQSLLGDNHIRQQLGESARAAVQKHHDIPVVVSRILSILNGYTN
jgi:glycosyltransferase involved in cell wall biosynthesis